MPRTSFATAALVASFAAGFVAAHLVERSARADSSSSSVYVPADGLTFRTLDGRVIARLAYDQGGGYFDVFDGSEHAAATVRAEAIGDPAVTRAPNPLEMRIK